MASFYSAVAKEQYKNVYYALNIALDDYLSRRLLENDSSRIVTCSTEYALMKRSGQQQWNNANLPFVNYKSSGKSVGGKRNWYSFEGYSQGLYISELRRKLRIVPITIDYDCTYWTGREDDYQYATDCMLIDGASETKLEFFLDYEGILVKNIAIIDFNFDMSLRFTETDWLERNNIKAFGINPSIQTFVPIDNTSGFCIPKTILFTYCIKKELISGDTKEDEIEHETLLQFTIDHMNEIITEN